MSEEKLTIEEIAKAAEEAFGDEDEVSGFAQRDFGAMGIKFLNSLADIGKPLEGCFTQGCGGGDELRAGYKM